MKVAYDISVVGVAQRYPESRTGVYRVVERLARGLAASPECELTLVGARSVEMYNWCAEALEASAELSAGRIGPAPVGAGVIRTLDRRITALVGPGAPLGRRIVRRGWITAFRAANRALAPLPMPVVSDVDVYHSPFDPLPARTGRARRILTVHDMIAELFPEHFIREVSDHMALVYGSLRPDDWVTAVSRSTKDDLCALRGVDPARVFVTPLAADPDMFHPVTDAAAIERARTRYGIPEGPYLLSLNTLEPRKNLEHAIAAFTSLVRQERVPGLSFVLVGGKGWKYEGIMRALERAGDARARIVMPGFVPDEDLAALYSGATAFTYLSRYEGFGLPPLEAMQCGTPVITSNTSSLPEVVGDAGIMLDPDDLDGLSEAMLRLYRDDALRADLSQRSRARAAEFSWDRFVGQTLHAYRAALASGRG